MKVNGPKDITGIDRPSGPKDARPQPAAEPAADARQDKVTIEGSQVAEMLSSARQRTQATRTGRLRELETALRGGTYRPDVGQLAEKLLSAAEIDARLRAMMRG